MAKTDTNGPAGPSLQEAVRAAVRAEADAPRRALLAELARARADHARLAEELQALRRRVGAEWGEAIRAGTAEARDRARAAFEKARDDQHLSAVHADRAEAALLGQLRPIVDGLLEPARERLEGAERRWGLFDVNRGFESLPERDAARAIARVKAELARLIDHGDPAAEAGRLLDELESDLSRLWGQHQSWKARPTEVETAPKSVRLVTQVAGGGIEERVHRDW